MEDGKLLLKLLCDVFKVLKVKRNLNIENKSKNEGTRNYFNTCDYFIYYHKMHSLRGVFGQHRTHFCCALYGILILVCL